MKILIMENQLRKVQFMYLDYLFDGIYEVKSKKHPDSRFWKKNDILVLELEKSGRIWVLHEIWKDLCNMFSLQNNETQQIMKEWLEERLNLEGIRPMKALYYADNPSWRKDI
jgi:hypothetical protein